MHRVLILSLVVLFLSHCGRNVSSSPQIKQSGPQTPNPAPQPSNSPFPTSGFKWTNEELNSNTENCAQAGSSDFPVATWKIFCRCAYEEAARRWTFEEFESGFEQNYQSLYEDGIIQGCLDKAKINF